MAKRVAFYYILSCNGDSRRWGKKVQTVQKPTLNHPYTLSVSLWNQCSQSADTAIPDLTKPNCGVILSADRKMKQLKPGPSDFSCCSGKIRKGILQQATHNLQTAHKGLQRKFSLAPT